MNKELYDLLKKCSDKTGLPVMKKELFLKTIDDYGKEDFRKTLAEYITNEKPPFPLAKFEKEKAVDNFRKLQSADFTEYITLDEKDRVIEKYDDYKYPY